jgi:hypothetical protein
LLPSYTASSLTVFTLVALLYLVGFKKEDDPPKTDPNVPQYPGVPQVEKRIFFNGLECDLA